MAWEVSTAMAPDARFLLSEGACVMLDDGNQGDAREERQEAVFARSLDALALREHPRRRMAICSVIALRREVSRELGRTWPANKCRSCIAEVHCGSGKKYMRSLHVSTGGLATRRLLRTATSA